MSVVGFFKYISATIFYTFCLLSTLSGNTRTQSLCHVVKNRGCLEETGRKMKRESILATSYSQDLYTKNRLAVPSSCKKWENNSGITVALLTSRNGGHGGRTRVSIIITTGTCWQLRTIYHRIRIKTLSSWPLVHSQKTDKNIHLTMTFKRSWECPYALHIQLQCCL